MSGSAYRQEVCLGGGSHCADPHLSEVGAIFSTIFPWSLAALSLEHPFSIFVHKLADVMEEAFVAGHLTCYIECAASCCRFDFKLSPGQIPLAVHSPFTLGPKKGIFVTPILRIEE